MRPIKFRAISKLPIMGVRTVHYFTLDDILRGKINFAYPEHYDFSQFTGLIDKNGKEIYEGDVVESKRTENRQVVEYRDILASDDMTAPGIGFQFNTEPSEMEVIGNIYENPNLLK